MKFDTEFSWSDHVARLSDRDFKLRYRLTLHAFNRHGDIVVYAYAWKQGVIF